jgi:hypothetical protein
MTAIEQLRSMLPEIYISEDEEEYKVELKAGLSDEQIDSLALRLPGNQIPGDTRELLRFSSGFNFYSPEEVTFDGVGKFGFENYFPNTVQLAGDGFGNLWIIDVDNKGNWGYIYYVCHDPAVVVKHSENLTQFLQHINEFGKIGDKSNLDIIHESVVMDVWKKNNGFLELHNARQSDDTILRTFALSLPDNFVIADLRNKPNQTGFAWGKLGSDIGKVVRYESEPLWAIEKPSKKGLFSKLFRK